VSANSPKLRLDGAPFGARVGEARPVARRRALPASSRYGPSWAPRSGQAFRAATVAVPSETGGAVVGLSVGADGPAGIGLGSHEACWRRIMAEGIITPGEMRAKAGYFIGAMRSMSTEDAVSLSAAKAIRGPEYQKTN
jgi:hypothetical protein